MLQIVQKNSAQPSHHARLFICGFGQNVKSWAEALALWGTEYSGARYDGDILVLGELGAEVLKVRGQKHGTVPFKYSASDGVLSDEEAIKLKAEVSAQLKCLASYERIELCAHSFGVRLMAYYLNCLPQEWCQTKKISAIALAGTVSAVGKRIGVPKLSWEHTISGLSVSNMEQFYLNLFNTPACYFNLRGEAQTLRQALARQEMLAPVAFAQRLSECLSAHGAADDIKLISSVVTGSACYYLGASTDESAVSLPLMQLSAELSCAPQVPLGELGISRFSRYCKLHYGYSGDLICPAAAVKNDVAAQGGNAVVRELDGAHLNCAQIGELLFKAEHEDWDLVAKLQA